MNTTALLLLTTASVLILFALYLLYWLYKESKKTSGKGGIDIVKQNASPEEMSHMIVHELRAPVVAIRNSSSLLLTGNLSKDDEKDMLKMVSEQADKLLSTISTILDTGKVNQGKLELNKELADLGSLVKEEVGLFQSEANTKKINITMDVSSTLPMFYFDKVRFTEVLNNLISNSLKYSNENGIIKITVRQQGANAFLQVADNGIGIAANKQKNLFKKYSQANASSKTQKISSGLGLFITKWIVEAHGGTIRLESEEGKGTTTKITLPLVLKPNKKDNTQEKPILKPQPKKKS